jgi:hypothetical protein
MIGSREVLQYFWNLISSPGVSKSRKTVSRSSTEAEYKSMADATTEIMWIQSVLCELQVPGSYCARLWCDNLGSKYLAFNPIFHGCINYVKINYHFVQDLCFKEAS